MRTALTTLVMLVALASGAACARQDRGLSTVAPSTTATAATALHAPIALPATVPKDGYAMTGEALVGFGEGLCGGAGDPPGIYSVRPGRKPRLVVAYAEHAPDQTTTQRVAVWTTS